MTDKQHMYMDELLVKYLAGEADAAEKLFVEDWISAAGANRQYFEDFKLIWDKSAQVATESSVDENTAWERFRERVQKEYAGGAKLSGRKLPWLKIAAVLLLAVGATLAGRYFIGSNNGGTRSVFTDEVNQKAELVKSVTGAGTKTDTLPDGSVVKLGTYSGLYYPRKFSTQKRYVALTGEAFFNVDHEASRPFIIKTSDLLITVLGTSFHVKNTGGITEVDVATGMVSVEKGQRIVMLRAGENLSSSINDTTLTKSPAVSAGLAKVATQAAQRSKTKPDSVLDFRKHPELLQKLLKNPGQWSAILKGYHAQNNDISVRRAIVRSVISEIKKEQLAGNDTVRSFRLNENEFFINDVRQPETVLKRFKSMFLKEPGYAVYLNGMRRAGRGVYLSPDSL